MAAAAIIIEEEAYAAKRRHLSAGKRSLAQDLIACESSGSSDAPTQVVIVMDGLKEFSMEPLEWVLKHIALEAYCTVTLLGVMPWLNIPLSSKTWSEIWAVDPEDLLIMKERTDAKYHRVLTLTEICHQYGVKLQIRSQMGYPLQQVVVDRIIDLDATLVVFDRHQQKYREYYAKKLPCNMVMINDEGEVDMIQGQPLINNMEVPPAGSPASSAPTPKLIVADHLKRIFKQKD
ncbi:uncharacterized protein LOC127786932 [Diospyros lotus]|uniref:uncharacterized protein LOC127786932 n=1 Tax=Diospyros lotus TaxID=55363 RepID=UPI002253BD7D|nr:uncharacterized protein LOC127786932 [Diospyros lotus]